MSSFRIFDIVGSALSAQSTRLNTVASNLANADSVAATPEAAYKARMPVFQTALDQAGPQAGSQARPQAAGVRVLGVVESQAENPRRFEPGNPLADADGYVYAANVNVVEEMTNMISASRSYQSSIEVMNTAKDLAIRTLSLGK